MTSLLDSAPQRIAAAFAAVALAAIGFLPLFGGPGYEQALAAGVLLPTAAAIATALDVARAEKRPSAAAMVLRGVTSGLFLAGIGFATALVHGVRVGFCDLAGGARGYALTAAIGTVMGGAWGAMAGELARRARNKRLPCTLLGLLAPLGGIVVSLLRFYFSPMVFAFDPFFGYFSGTLYDTVIDAGTPLLTYRAGSLSTIAAMALVATLLERNERGALRLVSFRGDAFRIARLTLAVTFAVASVTITLEGAPLGHWQTVETISSALGGGRSGPRCDVVFPDSLRNDESALLVRDCEQELSHDEAALGVTYPGRITAFYFRDAAEKKHFMGAADTYIAKPWRREVYLQLHAYPHPVLGHEIAHVVAGTFGRGPLRIAGAAGGLWPNPGLIEGVAVAASPDEEELSDGQWAHAMLELGILPSMQRVFSFGFLGDASAKSYTLAGAFLRWVIEKWGTATVQAWYGGGDITKLTGLGWTALDDGFRAWIAATPLTTEASSFAKSRFDRPSVFGRTCPHVIDALRREADGCRNSLEIDKARRLYSDVLVRDPHDWAARYGMGIVELRYGDTIAGRVELQAMADDEIAPRDWRDRSAESLADQQLASAKPADWLAAAKAYTELASKSVDEDAARTEEVKAYAATKAAGEPLAHAAIVSLLVGLPGRPVDTEEAFARVGAWAAVAHDPVAEYVYGKNLANHEFWAESAEHLDRALAAGEPTPRIGRELLRQRAICACALSDAAAVADIKTRVESPTGPFASSVGRRDWLAGLLDRCLHP